MLVFFSFSGMDKKTVYEMYIALQRWIIHSDAGLAWPKDTPQDKLHEDNHLADQASQHNQDHNVLFSSEKKHQLFPL